ncbi:hypothetical protein KCU95_g5898, partial [Aureobasidium melanogenum]
MKSTSANGGRPSTNLVQLASGKTLIASSTRTRTPFLEFTVNEVNALCKCISPIAKATPSKHKRGEATGGEAILSRSASSAVCSAEHTIVFEHQKVFFEHQDKVIFQYFQGHLNNLEVDTLELEVYKPVKGNIKHSKSFYELEVLIQH